MLSSIDVVPPAGAAYPTLHMYLQPANSLDLLQVREVRGLEPVVASIQSRQFGVVDGEYVVGQTLPKRNVVIKVGLNPVAAPNSVAAARSKVYAYFPPKHDVRLQFNFTDRDSVWIDGYVESATGDRFVADPTMDISVICPRPDFFGLTHEINGLTGTDEDSPVTNAPYIGDALGGLLMEIEAGDSEIIFSPVSIQSRIAGSDDTWREMYFGTVYVPAGRKIQVNTHQGSKFARVLAPPEDHVAADNIFPAMADQAYWMTLFAETHEFRVIMPDSATPRDWKLTYQDKFIGV